MGTKPANNVEALDEGVSQGYVRALDFTGSGVTVTVSGSTATVAVSGGGGGGANGVTATVNFDAGFTDKAQVVVSGQAWVAANSKIVPQVLTPAGTDPDEMRLLELEVEISDIVAGNGFTVTVYSEPEARGAYDVMCVGV